MPDLLVVLLMLVVVVVRRHSFGESAELGWFERLGEARKSDERIGDKEALL